MNKRIEKWIKECILWIYVVGMNYGDWIMNISMKGWINKLRNYVWMNNESVKRDKYLDEWIREIIMFWWTQDMEWINEEINEWMYERM